MSVADFIFGLAAVDLIGRKEGAVGFASGLAMVFAFFQGPVDVAEPAFVARLDFASQVAVCPSDTLCYKFSHKTP